MKDIKRMAAASGAKKAKAITGGALKHSAHAQKGMKNGGGVRIVVGPAPSAGMPMKRKCGGRT